MHTGGIPQGVHLDETLLGNFSNFSFAHCFVFQANRSCCGWFLFNLIDCHAHFIHNKETDWGYFFCVREVLRKTCIQYFINIKNTFVHVCSARRLLFRLSLWLTHYYSLSNFLLTDKTILAWHVVKFNFPFQLAIVQIITYFLPSAFTFSERVWTLSVKKWHLWLHNLKTHQSQTFLHYLP